MKKVLGGWLWIAGTIALVVLSFAADDDYAIPLAELAIPAVIALVACTWVPGVREWLPWGRALARWETTRIARGIEAMEREVDDEPQHVAMTGTPYRGGLLAASRPRRRRSDRRVAVALVVGGALTALFTLGVAGFLARHDLTTTMAASGTFATVVLALLASRDQGRAEAKARLRVEAGVREMEAMVRIDTREALDEPDREERVREERA